MSGRLGDSVVIGVWGDLLCTGGRYGYGRGANLTTEGGLGVCNRSVAGVGGGNPVDCCDGVSVLFCQRFCNARTP